MNSNSKPRAVRASDLRALWQLAHHATTEVVGITEAMHQNVRATMGLPAGTQAPAPGVAPGQASHRRTGGLTGLVYQSVRGITHVAGHGVQAALKALEPWLARQMTPAGEAPPERPSAEREALLAALNGVMGDRLVALGSPWATPMQLLAAHGQALAPAAAAAGVPRTLEPERFVLFLHGLCMNDLQWQSGNPAGEGRQPPDEPPADEAPGMDAAKPAGVNMGDSLQSRLGLTPRYVRYNSGRHVSDNGAALAALLEAHFGNAPAAEAPGELHIVAHSMGGLVARSAIEQARQAGMHWPARVKHLVFLGTPHHGAPLERAGQGVDALLGALRFTAPIGRLAKLRSAGITDLRHGHVLAADWQGQDRFREAADTRTPLPLPEGIACHTVAATTAARRGAVAERLLGDGLVPLRSALGQHEQARHQLRFATQDQRVFFRMNHFELLHHPQVLEQVAQWLQAPP